MLDLKQKGAMAKTSKPEPKIAERSFSRIIRKEMFLNIPITFNSPILLLTYYCNCFWKKNCPVLSCLFCCFLIKISICCLFKSLVNWEKNITITLIWYYPYLLRNCWIEAKKGWLAFFYCLNDSFGRRKKPWLLAVRNTLRNLWLGQKSQF